MNMTWEQLKKRAETEKNKGDWATYSRYVQVLKKCPEVKTYIELDRYKAELAKILEV